MRAAHAVTTEDVAGVREVVAADAEMAPAPTACAPVGLLVAAVVPTSPSTTSPLSLLWVEQRVALHTQRIRQAF